MKPTEKLRILWFMLWQLIHAKVFRWPSLCDLMFMAKHKDTSPVEVGVRIPKAAQAVMDYDFKYRSMNKPKRVPTDYLWWPLNRKGNRARIRAVVAAMFRALWQIIKHVFTFQWTYGL